MATEPKWEKWIQKIEAREKETREKETIEKETREKELREKEASFSLVSFSLASFSLASFSFASFSLASFSLASFSLASYYKAEEDAKKKHDLFEQDKKAMVDADARAASLEAVRMFNLQKVIPIIGLPNTAIVE